MIEISCKTRFWSKVLKPIGLDGCWEWVGSKTGPGGYGIMFLSGKRKVLVHRLSWMIHRGEIPKGKFVCHHCDNKACVNPEHLFLGDHVTNAEDAVRKRRLWNQKLSMEKAREIRELYATDRYSQRGLARMFGVAWISISRIIRGLAYVEE